MVTDFKKCQENTDNYIKLNFSSYKEKYKFTDDQIKVPMDIVLNALNIVLDHHKEDPLMQYIIPVPIFNAIFKALSFKRKIINKFSNVYPDTMLNFLIIFLIKSKSLNIALKMGTGIMNQRLKNVCNYSQQEYEDKKSHFSPQGFFLDINCFADKAEEYIFERVKLYKLELPPKDQIPQYLEYISDMTKQSTREITDKFEKESSFQVKEKYKKLISQPHKNVPERRIFKLMESVPESEGQGLS